MPQISISAVPAAREIDRAAWERLTPGQHPFLNADFFCILERHEAAGPGCGWHAHHLVATGGDGTVLGIAPSYVKTNSHGDFVRDWSWASAYQQLGKTYYPKLLTALPHTPAKSPRLLVESSATAETIQRTLIAAGKEVVAANSFSSWHVALPADTEVELFRDSGLLVSHDVQFQWRDHGYGDFDGFLCSFASERRRKVKAERRRVRESGLRIEVRHGNEISAEEWPALHQVYASTFEKFGNYAAFSPACFAELGATLGRRMVLFIALDGANPVAISICFRSDNTLYGRYWGSIGQYHSLHFELCFYQGIAYCLQEGLTTFEPGAGGEHKVARGFEPTVVRSCHWIADERMRHLIGQHLERQQDGIVAYAEEARTHLPFRIATADSPPTSKIPPGT
jgi:predicted N-acyltransferase